MLSALSISLNTNAVLPHDVGPATMAVNECTRGSMSPGTSRRGRHAIYTFLSSSSSPLKGRGRVRARARSAPSPVSVAQASRRDPPQIRQPVRRRINYRLFRCAASVGCRDRNVATRIIFHVCCVEILLLFILVCVDDETVFDLYTTLFHHKYDMVVEKQAKTSNK